MRGPIFIRADLTIPANELSVRAIRAAGPGGQHVNRNSTGVRLSWRPRESAALRQLSERDQGWLLERLAGQLTKEGLLFIEADGRRSQLQNGEAARERFREILCAALERPKARIATKKSRAVQRRRLKAKRERSNLKQLRRRPRGDE